MNAPNPLALEAVRKARSAMIIQQPFFGTLALHLTLQEAPEEKTFATDGRTLFYNPDFALSLPFRQLMGVLAHEVMHPASKHHTRRNGRDADLWNQAADYAINPALLSAGFELPDGALIDPAFTGLSADAIFRLLEQRQKQEGKGTPQPGQGKPGQGNPQPGGPGGAQPGKGQQGQQPGQAKPGGKDPGGCGRVIDAAPANDAQTNSVSDAEWSARVSQAIAVAKKRGAGKIPAELEHVIKELTRARVDWRGTLRRFIDDSNSRDYSFMRPNRRYVAAGIYLPGYVPDRPAHVVAVVDTSGSVDEQALREVVSELQAILDEGAADRVTVIYADTQVQETESYEAGDIIKAEAKRGGGTSFAQPLRWIGENIYDASAILYLTDCDVREWGEEPAAPIIWAVHGEPKQARRYADRAPFGEAIVLTE